MSTAGRYFLIFVFTAMLSFVLDYGQPNIIFKILGWGSVYLALITIILGVISANRGQ